MYLIRHTDQLVTVGAWSPPRQPRFLPEAANDWTSPSRTETDYPPSHNASLKTH